MGQEYKVIFTENDLKSIRDNIVIDSPKSIDEILKSIPGYIEGSCYTYSHSKEQFDSGWLPTITVDGNNLIICIYDSKDYTTITQHLFKTLMYICGRFEIEDA